MAASWREKLHESIPKSRVPGQARKVFASHDTPGYGSMVSARPSLQDMEDIETSLNETNTSRTLLNELEATSISGNDIVRPRFTLSSPPPLPY